jgi:molybdopterin-guanine dinucleotide biosynthesis protein A
MEAPAAGFVLTGGASTRMGRDKALLPMGGRTLVEQVAEAVREAAGSATLVGAPDRYWALGLPAVADTLEPCGPLGGILTALRYTNSDWNLVVACDLPGAGAELLKELLGAARAADADALVPVGASGLPEPLCAVYHRRAAAAIEAALRRGVRKVTEALEGLRVESYAVGDAGAFHNLNTPEDWAAAAKR